jgi:hypothetical protein
MPPPRLSITRPPRLNRLLMKRIHGGAVLRAERDMRAPDRHFRARVARGARLRACSSIFLSRDLLGREPEDDAGSVGPEADGCVGEFFLDRVPDWGEGCGVPGYYFGEARGGDAEEGVIEHFGGGGDLGQGL